MYVIREIRFLISIQRLSWRYSRSLGDSCDAKVGPKPATFNFGGKGRSGTLLILHYGCIVTDRMNVLWDIDAAPEAWERMVQEAKGNVSTVCR